MRGSRGGRKEERGWKPSEGQGSQLCPGLLPAHVQVTEEGAWRGRGAGDFDRNLRVPVWKPTGRKWRIRGGGDVEY